MKNTINNNQVKMTKNEQENYIFNSIMEKYNFDGSNIDLIDQIQLLQIIKPNMHKSGFSEYFVLDQYQDILAFYDTENISDYINSLMPGTIDCLLERYDYDENMTLKEYFSKVIDESLSEPLMQW